MVPWTPQSVWMAQFDQKADPFHFDDTIAAGDRFEGGGFEWQAHAAPGPRHGCAHVLRAARIASSSRATRCGRTAWASSGRRRAPTRTSRPRSRRSRRIERLDPRVVIPGHGTPFADARGSIANVRVALAAFARDPAKNARHMAKVMFVFALLDRQAMRVEDVPAYVARVGCHADLDAAFPQAGRAGATRTGCSPTWSAPAPSRCATAWHGPRPAPRARRRAAGGDPGCRARRPPLVTP